MREWFDGAGYYMSCMVLFNTIYTLNIFANGSAFEKYCGNCNVAGITTFIIAIVFTVIGIVATIRIVTVDDTKSNTASTGKKFVVITVDDQTGENYFANFSVIVLTGIALPSNPNWFVLAIYLLIEITLGIVYVKKTMYYMNPVLSLMDFSIYRCTGKDNTTGMFYDGTYYFLTRGIKISEGTIIEYKNINSRVIRLIKKKKM